MNESQNVALGFMFAVSSLCTLAGSGAAQSQLFALTIPQDRLPKGCRLAPELPGEVKVNPSIWNSGPRLASIRLSIEGPPPTSSDPLKRDGTNTRSTEHVLEAYRARYLAESDGWVDVNAVLFDDPKWTTAAALIRLEGETPRIILGPIAIRVARSTPMSWAKGSDLVQACYEAVRKYISAMSLPRG